VRDARCRYLSATTHGWRMRQGTGGAAEKHAGAYLPAAAATAQAGAQAGLGMAGATYLPRYAPAYPSGGVGRRSHRHIFARRALRLRLCRKRHRQDDDAAHSREGRTPAENSRERKNGEGGAGQPAAAAEGGTLRCRGASCLLSPPPSRISGGREQAEGRSIGVKAAPWT